jgi:hypothetical protein
MPERKNIFGHSSITQPTTTNDRMTQMNKLLQEEELEQDSNVDSQNMSTGDLEQLVYLGCIEDSKKINNYEFSMRTLTGKEQNDVWLGVSFLTTETKFLVVKVAFLAKAIMSVNGRALELLYKGKDFRELTKEQRCIKVVESWQDTLINELYDFYSELVARSRKTISPELIKK